MVGKWGVPWSAFDIFQEGSTRDRPASSVSTALLPEVRVTPGGQRVRLARVSVPECLKQDTMRHTQGTPILKFP